MIQPANSRFFLGRLRGDGLQERVLNIALQVIDGRFQVLRESMPRIPREHPSLYSNARKSKFPGQRSLLSANPPIDKPNLRPERQEPESLAENVDNRPELRL